MRQLLLNSAQERVSQLLRARNERIFPVPVRGIFNFRCHQNCVQWVTDHPGEGLEVVEVIYLHASQPNNTILHYLVRDREGKYLEVTLGYEASQHEYYLVRTVPEQDWPNITSVFDRSLQAWLEEFTNPVIRWIFGIHRIL